MGVSERTAPNMFRNPLKLFLAFGIFLQGFCVSAWVYIYSNIQSPPPPHLSVRRMKCDKNFVTDLKHDVHTYTVE